MSFFHFTKTDVVWNSGMLYRTTHITDVIHLFDRLVTCRIYSRKYMLLHRLQHQNKLDETRSLVLFCFYHADKMIRRK